MTPYEAKSLLADLDELSVDNLRCGRITRDALHFAARQICNSEPLAHVGGPSELSSWDEMYLADALNDMLEAGRVLQAEREAQWDSRKGETCKTSSKSK